MIDAFGDLLPGLMPALWRGINFHMPDTSTGPGRRIAEHLFPGIDAAAYDDMGAAPEKLNVTGLIVGDDYVLKAQALRQAFATPGPATLVHPWFGPLRVIVTEPADIKLTARQLRVVTFTVQFTVMASAGGRLSRLSGAALISTYAPQLIAAAHALVASASAGRARGVIRNAATSLTSAVLATPMAAFNPIGSSPPALVLDWAQQLSAQTDTAVVNTSDSAVAPTNGFVASSPSRNPTAWYGVLQITASHLAASANTASNPLAVNVLRASAAIAIAEAALSFLHILPANRAEATAMRTSFAETLQTIRSPVDAEAAAVGDAASFEALCADLDAALAADINELSGRLPRVLAIRLSAASDAFLLAHHFAGDNPEAVETAFDAIIERNQPRHPSLLEEGMLIEVPR